MEKPEWIQQDVQPVRVYSTWANVKSVNQLRIVFPEPANATTMRDLVGSSATKPLMFAVVVSLLPGLESGQRRGERDLRASELHEGCHVVSFYESAGIIWAGDQRFGSRGLISLTI